MAYFVDGNIYLQDGSNPPFQLTHGGKDRSPTFSDDGEKIIFLRGLIPYEVYSVNTDGSQEQILISGSILGDFGRGYDEMSEVRSFTFVPGTHLLLFNTRELGELDVKMQDGNRTFSKSNDDLLTVDTDTGEIKTLLTPDRGGNFFLSPDGNIVAVQSKGRVDLVNLDGQVIRQSFVTYTPTRPYELTPGISWVENSTELIVTLPVGVEYDMDGPETRTIWRYRIAGDAKFQVSLSPPVIGNDYSISPDGNWILYNYFYYPGKTDETVTSGLYLGNLREGGSHLYSPGVSPSNWSSDSLHFTFEGAGQGLSLGMTDGQPIPIDSRGRILGWTDDLHYLYFHADSGLIKLGDMGGNILDVPHEIPPSSVRNGTIAFSYIFIDHRTNEK